jgi:tRNA (pseudouridine54-N1)-methyltransferase
MFNFINKLELTMRTFIIKARKASTAADKIRSQIGTKDHFEVVLHSVMNAFFVASDFRDDVEVYIVLDSSEDFPRTIKLSSSEGLSIAGFHETAILQLIEQALMNSSKLSKNESKHIAPGVHVFGYGFEKLVKNLLEIRPIFILDKKGKDIRSIVLPENPVFILSDHLMMPKKTILGLRRRGLESLSLGKRMLFASQCIVLINHELDLQLGF